MIKTGSAAGGASFSRISLCMIALGVFLGWYTVPSNAASVPCESDLQSGITANGGCEVGSDKNDSADQVNDDEMFDVADWTLLTKQEYKDDVWSLDGSDSHNLGLTVTGDRKEGGWEINDLWDTFDKIMLVLKGGNSNYIGFLLMTDQTKGDYSSVLVNNNGHTADISHISAYGVSAVPLPAAVYLFGTALAGMGYLGFRRRRVDQTS